ncbi:MAG: aminotransferase class I/II-fold pyridoxal phosphate-dependent enzyme [Candidatus Heimdallarchaeota archaeon]|nr:aminotransferase class I/II-fold pyridoxal phosphate-dependent enzyme [Candidatus Heimdallarchaeota archaeon]
MSDRISELTYAIRDIQVIADKLKAQGHEILQFNIGDPQRFDYDVPNAIKDQLKSVLDEAYYSNSVGDIDVRQAIAKYENDKNNLSIDPRDMIYFQGVSEGMLFSFLAFLNPGDRILVPGPAYPAYNSLGTVCQAEVISYRCIEKENWIPDIDDIAAKLTPNTKLVVVINPNNPTGSVYSEKVLREIRDIVGQSDAIIISDEIYDKLVIEGNYTPFSSLTKDVPMVVFNGFSKVYLVPGYRAAYGYIIDKTDAIEQPWDGVRKLCRVRLSASTPISKAVIAALDQNPKHLPSLISKIKSRRDLVLKRFNEIDQIASTTPKAAFYIFPKIDLSATKFRDDKEFALSLLEEKQVLVVHGSGFGKEYGQNHFRMVYLAPEEVLEEGLTRIADFLR